MKRIISIVCTICFLMVGVAAVADNAEAATAERLLNLSFADVEGQVTSGNLTIRNNRATIQNMNDMFDNDIVFALMSSQDTLALLNRETIRVRDQIAATVNPAEPDPELDPLRAGIIAALNNDIASFGRDMAQIEAQINQFHNAPRASVDRAAQQLGNVNKQIVWGAESLFMGYHTLSRQLDQSNENLNALSRNIEILEHRYSLGQITETTLSLFQTSIIVI